MNLPLRGPQRARKNGPQEGRKSSASASPPRTVIEVLAARAAADPDGPLYTFLPEGAESGGSDRNLTLGALERRSRTLAETLLAAGLQGERVLLVHPPGLAFVEAFFACLRAGVIAVPAPPPRPGRGLIRLASIATDSGALAALTTPEVLARAREIAASDPATKALEWLVCEAGEEASRDREPVAGAGRGEGRAGDQREDGERAGKSVAGRLGSVVLDPGAVAYLQYTSGSTSAPKGVMVSHTNVLANSEAIRRGFAHGPGSRSLSWLPHFHDMGLIDGIVQPLYSGFRAFLMSPASFLKNPARWLEAIAAHRITHSGGPNFAYELCARRIAPDPETLDLSAWEVATNGAEPVRAETLARFAARFAPCGFRREAFYPAYGLAEATLKVSGGERGRGPVTVRVSRAALEAGRAVEDPQGVALVGSGHAAMKTRLAIVDPESARARGEGEVGEIWVSGPGVALGYWNRTAETEQTFGARLGKSATPFLRTGDLGFLHAGELFVAGRAKDLVIIRGRNIYPQDVEAVAASCEASLAGSASAAFGVDVDGEERLALVQEVPRHVGDPAALLTAVRAAIVDALEVDPGAVVLVRAGGVPRTSSGKVRRAECRRAFLAGELPVVVEWHAASTAPEDPAMAAADPGIGDAEPPAAWLTSRIASKAGVAPGAIDPEAPFAALGVDSLRALELAHEIERRFGVAMTAVDLLAAPSVAAIADRLGETAALAPGDTAAQGRGDGPGSSSTPAEPAAADPEECALGAGQRALWFLHELDPEGAAYTIAAALALEGPVDEDALARAARELVARHASLRARIVTESGGPRQRFDVPFDAIFSREAIDASSEAARDAALATRAFAPFDLSRGPLFRVARLDAGDTKVLLVSAHHIVADLWSLSIVLRDLRALYAAQVGEADIPTGRAPHPEERVREEARFLGSARGEAQVAFWRERLSRPAPPLDLPSDRPRSAHQTFGGGVRTLRLDRELALAARALARSRGVTLYALLLAAYEAFLARVTGAKEIQVGVPAAGRSSARFAELVAYLVNPVVVRGALVDDPPFDEHLRRAAARLRDALENQDVPFPALVTRLAPERDAGRSPYFDTMFDLHASGDLVRGDLAAAGGSRASVPFAGGVVARPIALERRAAQFDLSVTVVEEEDGGLFLELEYNGALFDPSTVDALGSGYATLLASAVESPSHRVSELGLLPEPARAAALRQGAAALTRSEIRALFREEDGAASPAGATDGRGAEDGGGGFHRLFERAAAQAPEAVAVWHGEASISYGALNRRANALARRLRAHGVGPESRVVVGIEKSIDLIVSVMAVLKAGGAYVPVDPALPLARRRALVEDCGARVVLSRRDDFLDATAGAGNGKSAGIVVLDQRAWGSLEGGVHESENLREGVRSDNLAYVVYTSGTTGAPKGVGVTHANLRSAFEAWVRDYGLLSLPGHLQMAAPGFDVFSGDVARALGSGGALILCDREVLLDPAAFAALARRRGASFGDFVPAIARELAAHLERSGERLPDFRIVSIGSDAWTMGDYEKVRRGFGPDVRIFNSYGVTEATIDNAYGDVLPEDASRAVPPIGVPLAHTAMHVLDGWLEPLPAGVRGELYLGGPGVARGYIGSPDLTAARFLPDPHGEPGARLYRTGDRVRRLADGRVVFDGRVDGQLKVRAHRIEPAEIESVMAAHPEVRAAVAGARTIAGSPQIVVWIVPVRRHDGLVASVRAHAEARLPEYMTPSAIVLLDALPLSASGKVDRRALPDPDGTARGAAQDDGASSTETERLLAGIFGSVLGTGPVGRDANFFRLGGDSILAIQIVSRAREAGLRLAPSLLFEHPTVAGLSRAIERTPEPRRQVPPGAAATALTPIQRWFFEQEFDDPEHWNLAMALETREGLDPVLAQDAARALVAHHEALRTRFERGPTGWRSIIDPESPRGGTLTNVDAFPGETLEDAAARCAKRLAGRLDLAGGPVVGFGTVSCGAAQALVVVLHHLVADGVSLRVLAEDFERAYRSVARGVRPEPAVRTAAVGEWARALEAATAEGRFDGEIEHYRRLAAAVPAPPGFVSPDGARERDTVRHTSTLGKVETAGLRRAAAQRGVTVETLILAALASSTGVPALYAEIEGHGRDTLAEPDVSRTVGWFTETRPVLIEAPPAADLDVAVESARRATRVASSGGFGALRVFAPDPAVRDTIGRVPAPWVSVNYLGRFDAGPRDGALFSRMFEPAAPARSPRGCRTHALEIDASVLEDRLAVRWSWSPAQIPSSEVARLADEVLASLSRLAAQEASERVGTVLPLTAMQEGMLYHHLRGVHGGRDPYVSQIALEMTGEVDPGLLDRAWQDAASKFETLRAGFRWEDVPRPVQVIEPVMTIPVARHELEETQIDALMERSRAEGFDVSRPPLARVDLVRTGERRWVMVFTHHHLLLDGWSLPLVLEAVFAAHESFARGEAGKASSRTQARGEEAGGLARYLERTAARSLGKAELFFREYLAGLRPTPAPDPSGGRLVPATSDGSLGNGAGSGRDAERASESGVVSVAAPRELEPRARVLGLTPAAVLQAAWALVLAASTGERDVVFGITSSGREADVAGIESVVGLLIATLPLRVQVDPDATAVAWAAGVQRDSARLRDHEHAPLALVQRCAGTPPGEALFETLLVFENYPMDVAALGRRERFEVTGVRLHEETNYPLTLVAGEGKDGRLRAIYDRGRYDEEGARVLLGRLVAAVEGLLSRPAATLAEIPVHAAGEEERLRVAWNDTARPYTREASIIDIFDRVAEASPERTALVWEGGTLSYGALQARSGAVARALRARGIGPEARVALDMDRSPSMIVATLGVLRAGAACVPVDPDSPWERTAGMLAGAGVRLVVSGTQSAPARRGDLESVAFEALAPAGAADAAPSRVEEADGEGGTVPADALAYVMFTSGSTGVPKGIEMSQRNVLRLVLGAEYARFGPEETILQIATVSFDASIFEIWGALLHGGRLAIAPPGTRSAAEIVRAVEQLGASMAFLTAGLFHVVVEADAAGIARMGQVIAGGDVLSAASVRRLLQAGCRRVVNGYGPTETVTFAACGGFAPGDAVPERVPIGGPIANVRAYVLDGTWRLAPIGAPGELFLGGDGVARGYARRPDLTAERFLPDPFGPAGSRLYRTGDIARWRDDGRLEFLGRRDGQVKIRGFRVELAEAEAGLSRAPGVRAAAVVARETEVGRELVGYVVPEPRAQREPGVLRETLAGILPRYMIPSRIVYLDALPLTTNGKIDRAALAAAALPSSVSERPARALSAAEGAVARLWRRVLGVVPVSPEDDFFELGGHSLHAVRLLAAMRRAFRIDLPMAVLFETTTLAGHAAALVAREPVPGHIERAARALAVFEAMSEEERARRREAAGREASLRPVTASGTAGPARGAGAGEDA